MRIAIYGGSFNPPHLGHALVAAWLGWTDQVDAVWLVPVGSHAFGKQLAPFARRASWCERLAQTVGDFVLVEAIEESLPPPSYTLHTLQALAARHPEHRFRLVIGSDNLPSLPRWHRWADIERDFDPLIVGRVGHAAPDGVPSFPGISSTAVRARLVQGESVSALVPAPVLAAITPDDVQGWRSASRAP